MVWWFAGRPVDAPMAPEPGRSHWKVVEPVLFGGAKVYHHRLIRNALRKAAPRRLTALVNLKFDAAKGKLTIDAAQLGGLVSYNIDRLHELDEVGVVGFKCFVATCGDRGIDNDFRDVKRPRVLQRCAEAANQRPVPVHCENALICDTGRRSETKVAICP